MSNSKVLKVLSLLVLIHILLFPNDSHQHSAQFSDNPLISDPINQFTIPGEKNNLQCIKNNLTSGSDSEKFLSIDTPISYLWKKNKDNPDSGKIPELVLIEGGEFIMGDDDAGITEKPEHIVNINSFYLGKTEVTVKQFAEFIKSTNYRTDADKEGWSYIYTGTNWEKAQGVNWNYDVNGKRRFADEINHPVIHVSWNDADAYCKWAGGRLPTEAEWEYAARGGGSSVSFTKYSGSDNIDTVAWFAFNSKNRTHNVAKKNANKFGVFDMTGNVWEWCSDWYNKDYYKNSPDLNPRGPAEGKYKVLRGGAWMSVPQYCRLAYRYINLPGNRNSINGFRLAKDKL